MPMTDAEMQRHARELIDRSLPTWRDVRGYVDDEIPQTDEDERKTLVSNLNSCIRAAEITITWPDTTTPEPLGWMVLVPDAHGRLVMREFDWLHTDYDTAVTEHSEAGDPRAILVAVYPATTQEPTP